MENGTGRTPITAQIIYTVLKKDTMQTNKIINKKNVSGFLSKAVCSLYIYSIDTAVEVAIDNQVNKTDSGHRSYTLD